MVCRPVKLLILTCITLWATGAAQLAHECIEHGAGSQVERITPAVSDAPALSALDPDDGDCATCIMLASMACERAVPPLLPDLIGSCIEVLPPLDWQAPHLPLARIEPARGPPVNPPALLV